MIYWQIVFFPLYLQWRITLHVKCTLFEPCFFWESSSIFGLKIILTVNQMLILASDTMQHSSLVVKPWSKTKTSLL